MRSSNGCFLLHQDEMDAVLEALPRALPLPPAQEQEDAKEFPIWLHSKSTSASDAQLAQQRSRENLQLRGSSFSAQTPGSVGSPGSTSVSTATSTISGVSKSSGMSSS